MKAFKDYIRIVVRPRNAFEEVEGRDSLILGVLVFLFIFVLTL